MECIGQKESVYASLKQGMHVLGVHRGCERGLQLLGGKAGWVALSWLGLTGWLPGWVGGWLDHTGAGLQHPKPAQSKTGRKTDSLYI